MRFLVSDRLPALVAGLFMWTAAANAQDWQDSYDASGNFEIRTAASAIALPQILSQPQLQVVAPGELASFSVVMADARGLTYQWRFNGANLAGSTSDTLPLANVSATNEGPYSVVVANSSGSVTSAPAMLMLDSDGDGLPDSWEQTYFGNLTSQRSLGDPDGDGNSNLDEFRDGTSPTNTASARFRLTVLSDGGLVDVDPFRLSYTNGELVTLTAFPFPPNTFRGWTGDTTSPNASISLVMTTNKTVFAYMMPLVLTWTNGASGDWHVAANWSPNFVPASNDNVSIITPFVTVSVNAAAECGGLIFGDAASAPILTGTGTLVLSKDSLWTAGTMSGAGRTIIAEGASLNIANPGTVSLTTRTLENGGTVVWSGAGMINCGTAVMTNRPGALFHAQNAARFNFNGGSSRFDNAGTFRKSGSAGTTTVGDTMTFNNYNLVEILSGTLRLDQGGTNSGTFDLGTGTTLNLSAGIFPPGTFSSTAASSISGAGHLTVSGGTANLAGLVNLSGTNTFSGGTANLTGNYICTNNTMTLSGGIANFSGTGLVTPSVVDLSSGVLGGSGLVTVASQMSWTGGTMSGSGRTIIAPNATLNINNPIPAYLTARTLENAGTILWTGANIGLSTTVITNRTGAQFNVQNAAFLFAQSGNSRFDNAGALRKSANTGTTTFADGVSFNNSGMVEIQTGTLLCNGSFTNNGAVILSPGTTNRLAGGGTHTGSFDVPAGATLNLGGTQVSSAGSSMTGAGHLTVSGGTANLAGLVNLSGTNTFSGGTANLTGNYICTNNTLIISGGTANFNGTGAVLPAVVNLSSGTLSGSQVVTVGSVMNWTGGIMSGSGRTIIPGGVMLNVANAGTVFLTSRALENGGTVLWTGTIDIGMNGAVITNRAGALFHALDAADIYGSVSRFDNAGTFRKSANTGMTTVGVNFTNYGTVDIRSGILWAAAGYASSSNALLSCGLGGTNLGTGYARLQVSSTLTLDGALNVNLLPGFSPATNDTFTVVTGTRSGTFTSFTYPPNRVTMLLSNTPNSVILRVTEVLPIPQPTLLTPELASTNVLLTWTATSNVTYRLESNPDVNSTNWSAVPGDVTTLSNTASKLDALTSSNRLYRVRVLP